MGGCEVKTSGIGVHLGTVRLNDALAALERGKEGWSGWKKGSRLGSFSPSSSVCSVLSFNWGGMFLGFLTHTLFPFFFFQKPLSFCRRPFLCS